MAFAAPRSPRVPSVSLRFTPMLSIPFSSGTRWTAAARAAMYWVMLLSEGTLP